MTRNCDRVFYSYFISYIKVNSYRISHIVSLDPTADHIMIPQHKHEFALSEEVVNLPVNKFEIIMITNIFSLAIMNGFSISKLLVKLSKSKHIIS